MLMAGTKILVLGAGELGTSILTALSNLAPPNTSITVLLRPSTISSPFPSKITELLTLKNLGISFLPGDIATATPSELVTIFQPFDLIINCLGFSAGAGSQIKITHAVFSAKVPRFIPWQFGVDYDIVGRGSAQPVWDEQLDVRDLIRSQENTEWIIISTGMFTSFLFEPWFGVVENFEIEGEEEVVLRALGAWENKVTVTTPKDIGILTARAVFEDPRIKNEILFTAGETISYGVLAGIVERVVGNGKRVRREVWGVEKLRGDLKADPEDNVMKYRVVFAEGKGVSWDVERTFNWKRGIEVMDVESFAREKLGR